MILPMAISHEKNKINLRNHMQGFNRKISVGVIWNLTSLILSRGASMAFTLLLARFLAPEAFGLIAMIMVCFELAGVVVDSGLGQALIQIKHVKKEDLNTVFFANLGFGVIVYLLLYLIAPFIALFYNQPPLTLLIQITGLVILINAFKVVQISVLSRKMDFKSQMTANTVGAVISGILSVVMAYYGAGVWSLVAQMLLFSIISTLILWLSSNWRPSFIFSTVSFKKLFRFGGYLLMAGISNVAFQNTYLLVIGRLFTAEMTGLYFFARKLSTLLSQNLTSAVQNVTYPALSTIQEQNNALRHKYRQIIQLMMFLISPIMLLMAALAPNLIDFLFDEKWRGAVFYLQLFCIIGLLHPLHAMNVNLLKVKGRSDLILKLGIIKKVVNLLLLFMSLPFGITAIILSQIIGSLLALIPNTYFTSKLLDYGLKNQVVDTFKPIMIASCSGIISWQIALLIHFSMIIKIMCIGLSGTLVYLILSYQFKSEGFMLLYYKFKYRSFDLTTK